MEALRCKSTSYSRPVGGPGWNISNQNVCSFEYILRFSYVIETECKNSRAKILTYGATVTINVEIASLAPVGV